MQWVWKFKYPQSNKSGERIGRSGNKLNQHLEEGFIIAGETEEEAISEVERFLNDRAIAPDAYQKLQRLFQATIESLIVNRIWKGVRTADGIKLNIGKLDPKDNAKVLIAAQETVTKTAQHLQQQVKALRDVTPICNDHELDENCYTLGSTPPKRDENEILHNIFPW